MGYNWLSIADGNIKRVIIKVLNGNNTLTASQRESEVINAMAFNLLGGDQVFQENTAELALA